MKHCKKCKADKALSEFGKSKARLDGLEFYCRGCIKVRNAKYRKNNPEKIKAISAKYYKNNPERLKQDQKNRRDKHRTILRDILGHTCQHCGHDGTVSPLEFHHIDPSSKSFNIGNRLTLPLDKLILEAHKCITLCDPCHRAEHVRLNRLKK